MSIERGSWKARTARGAVGSEALRLGPQWGRPAPRLLTLGPFLQCRQYARGTGGVLADDMGLGEVLLYGCCACGAALPPASCSITAGCAAPC